MFDKTKEKVREKSEIKLKKLLVNGPNPPL